MPATRPPLLYSSLAPLWRLLSPPSDYLAEAQQVLDLLHAAWRSDPPFDTESQPNSQSGSPSMPTLLELGCGGGHLMHHLTEDLRITGVDLSRDMLEACAALNPDATLHWGDLRSIRLPERFDAVLIHDACDYLLTPCDVASAIQTARAHLKPAGALVLAPTHLRETFTPGQTACDASHDIQSEAQVAWVEVLEDADPADDLYTLRLLITARRDGKLEIYEDEHTCAMHPRARWIELLRAEGFDPLPPPPPHDARAGEQPMEALTARLPRG